MATTPAFTDSINTGTVQLTDTTASIVFTAGANGSLLNKLRFVTDDETVSHVVKVFLRDGSNDDHFLGYVSLSTADAVSGIPYTYYDNFVFDLDPSSAEAYSPYFRMDTGYKIVVQLTASPTATKEVHVIAEGGDY